MSSLLNSLKLGGGGTAGQHTHQRDEHGVAELLDAVSKRSLSCTEEERREIGDIVKRVQNYKKSSSSPGPIIERLQQMRLPQLVGGEWNVSGGCSSSSSTNTTRSSSIEGTPVHSPTITSTSSPVVVNNNNVNNNNSSWSKDLMRGLAKLNISNPLSSSSSSSSSTSSPPESPFTHRRTMKATNISLSRMTPSKNEDDGTTDTNSTTGNGLLRGFRAPTFKNLMANPTKAALIGNNVACDDDSPVASLGCPQEQQRDLLRESEPTPPLLPVPTFAVLPPEDNNNNNNQIINSCSLDLHRPHGMGNDDEQKVVVLKGITSPSSSSKDEEKNVQEQFEDANASGNSGSCEGPHETTH